MYVVCSHLGDSYECTQYTIFNIKSKITLNYPKSAAMFLLNKRLEKEVETAVVNESSVFEALKFYCTKMFYANVHLMPLLQYDRIDIKCYPFLLSPNLA